MPRYTYLRARKNVELTHDNTISRFAAGRIYEVDVRNAELVELIEEDGRLAPAERADYDAQLELDEEARSAGAGTAGNQLSLPGPEISGKISTS